MESQKIGWISDLFSIDGQEIDTQRLADRVAQLFDAAETILWPIIGKRGTTMLQSENLKTVAAIYPWLSVPNTHSLKPAEFLRSLLLDQTPELAAACAEAVLQNFCKILVDLIGFSVTDALLRPVLVRSHAEFAQGI